MLFTYSVRAPEFPTAEWLNTDAPLSLTQLKGHVVVLDFWTYCCINCIHVIPDLKFLEQKYAKEPVVVIGVHSPKFVNERETENIRNAIARYQIGHPVIVDSEHQIWNSYAVRAWPTLVVIGPEGKIRAHLSGEGHREELDQLVDQLIREGRKNHILTKQPIRLHKTEIDPSSTLAFPGKLCFDDEDGIYISDSNHNRIIHAQLTSPKKAEVLQIIGAGTAGWQDGTTQMALFRQPQGLTYKDKKLFVCDTENHLLRVVDLEKGTVSTLAGTGQQAEWGSRGGSARVSALSSPWDVVVTDDDDVLIAMAGSHQIWRYMPGTDRVEIFAGSGAENIVDGSFATAQFAQSSGIAYHDGIAYVADSEVSAIRKLRLHDQRVQTLVGHGLFTFGLQDGKLEDGLLQHPLGITVAEENLFIADTYNHALRQLDLQRQTLQTIIRRQQKTVCMIGDKDCGELPLNEPNDVKARGQYLYIADTNNHLIRVYDRVAQTLSDLEIVGL